MREILYIGRCVGEDDVYGWVDGYYVRLKDPYKNRESHRIYTGFAECDCGDFYGDWYEVDPKTVRQFTGLFDKNGRRIFDGDIIKALTGNAVGDVIEATVTVVLNDHELMYDIEHSFEIEVVGNIYDNSKLIL